MVISVLHLISSTGFFGAENVIISLTKELQYLGIKPYIGVFNNLNNPHLELVEVAYKKNIPVQIFNCNGRLDLGTVNKIRKFLRDNNIVIMHSHGYKSNFYSFLATFNTNVKRIATCHNWLGKNFKMHLYEKLDKLLLRTFCKVVVVSDVLKQEVLHCGIPQSKITVINNGVNVDRFQNTQNNPILRKMFGITEDEKIICTIGRLTAEKGHVYLLKAAKRIIAEFPSAKFLIVGDGPLLPSLKSQISSLKLEGKFIFAGIRKDIPEILNIIDIFVLPSLDEGMPMVLLEAMAAKKPIIASKVGAIPKLIEHNTTGLLIEPKNTDGIYTSIVSLLNNKEKMESLSTDAFERVKNEFSSLTMAQKYLVLYIEILKGNQGIN